MYEQSFSVDAFSRSFSQNIFFGGVQFPTYVSLHSITVVVSPSSPHFHKPFNCFQVVDKIQFPLCE